MHVVNTFDVSLQIVVQKLEKEDLVFREFHDDIEFVEHSEAWMGKYGPSKYKSKDWTDVKSTPAKEDMDASFAMGNGKKSAREKGLHHNTPSTGD